MAQLVTQAFTTPVIGPTQAALARGGTSQKMMTGLTGPSPHRHDHKRARRLRRRASADITDCRKEVQTMGCGIDY